MSHAATNWAFEQRGLKPATKMVLLALANCHNPHHGCFPSKRRLAEDCEMSERSVADHVRKLEDLGLIEIEKSAQKRMGHFPSNRYILKFERENCRGQKLPTANSADGKNEHQPTANSADGLRQILPTNPVKEPRKGTSNDSAASAPSFSAFWDAWPVKVSKCQAEKNWKKLSADDRRAAVQAAKAGWFDRWRRKYPDAAPIHPGTFISKKRWTDQDELSAAPETDDWLAKLERKRGQSA